MTNTKIMGNKQFVLAMEQDVEEEEEEVQKLKKEQAKKSYKERKKGNDKQI